MSDQGGFRPGGLGGRPTLPSGEPVMARWFSIFLLIVIPIGVVVTIISFLSFSREQIPAAARRPPGDIVQTHNRGQAVLAETQDVVIFSGCVDGIRLVGDEGGIATAKRALQVVCQLVESPFGAEVEAGLSALAKVDGSVRVAVFEVTGVDANTRIEDGKPVVELNAKFQFGDAAKAAPALVHELVHLGRGFPAFGPITVSEELAAVIAQDNTCKRLSFRDDRPRTCLDAEEILAHEDPTRALVEAGYLN